MSRRFSYFFEPFPPAFTVTGYLANWKIFEPKRVSPVSIEACIAPIAVMTEITEKTPIVIPSMVSAERNLFAPTEAMAMVRISRNCMGKFEIGMSKFYSYLRAVTGSSREALQAGAVPEINPVRTDTIMLATTKPNEKRIGKEGKAFAIPKHNR